jgi:hypothetical protein
MRVATKMDRNAYIVTRVIHVITAILLLFLGGYYLYWGLKPIEDNEKSLRGIMVIPGAVCLILALIPVLSLLRVKLRHSQVLQYAMAALSSMMLLYIIYTYLTE